MTAEVPTATVLVVDDDPLKRTMLAMSLGSAGYVVLEAGNASEGLAVLDAEGDRVDVVLTDIEMPMMDGYAFLQNRHGNAALKAIPFIVISGVEEMASIIACIKLGAEDFPPKPFDPVLLHARIGACVEKKRMTDELRDLNQHLAERVDEKVREVERLTMLRRFVSPQLAEAHCQCRRIDPGQSSTRDHGAVLRPTRVHGVFGDGRAGGSHGRAA